MSSALEAKVGYIFCIHRGFYRFLNKILSFFELYFTKNLSLIGKMVFYEKESHFILDDI